MLNLRKKSSSISNANTVVFQLVSYHKKATSVHDDHFYVAFVIRFLSFIADQERGVFGQIFPEVMI